SENYVTIGLTAVCASYQGKGIGKKLLESVENELSKKHIKELRIPTQLQNKQACKFYKKSGFNIVEETIIKHYWKL
ncbi:MAG: GNAT family N-acetyltransferase, partial [Flavobacteriaceae bacterium]|nr:GNAT family N-acetyltransferase [Flavobacteriaceae bacterium]